MSESDILKHAHGRYNVAIDISAADYEAATDGKGRSIPFQVNASEEVDLSVKLEDSAAFVTQHFNPGSNPSLVVAIEADAAVSATLVAEYPYKPATVSITV